MSGMIQPSYEKASADLKVNLVLEGLRKERPIAELCREAGISTTSYYQWRRQVIDAARDSLAHPEVNRRMLEERIAQLEAENCSLQRQVRILQELCLAE